MIGELTRQELVKLLRQRFPYFLLAIVLLLQTVSMLVAAFSTPASSLDVVTGLQLWADGATLGLRLTTFVLLVIGAMSFSRELSLGTAKTMLLLPITRRQWATGKLLALVKVSSAMILMVALLGAAITAFTAGWGTVVRDGATLYTSSEAIQQALTASILTILLLIPLCAASLLIGLHFSSSGSAVGVAVILGVILEAGVNLADSPARYVFFFHLSRPFALVSRMGRGLPLSWEPVLTWGLGVGVVSFLVFAVWLVVRLDRMDIRG